MNNDVDYWMDKKYKLLSYYEKNQKKYNKILAALSQRIDSILAGSACNAQIKGRIKSFDAFYRKLLARSQKVSISNPFEHITDIVGMRIVVPFIEDLESVENIILKNFEIIETEYKSRELTIREFGYDSIHILISLPEDIAKKYKLSDSIKIEIQLRTILQDAWAEVEHELIYKTTIDKVEDTIRRKMIALNATLSLADITFQEIREYQRKRYRDIQERHKKLMDKVSTIPEKMGKIKNDAPLINPEKNIEGLEIEPKKFEHITKTGNGSEYGLNDLMVEAMNAHLENRLQDAVALYTQLIIVSPNHFIYNHRGLVYFTLSEYDKAIDDFTTAIKMAPNDTRVYTNRGLTYRMLKKYDESLADFNKSLELNPLWPDTFYGRSLTYYDLGDIQRALEDCDKAISIKPDFKQAVRFKQFLINQTMT